ncbi:MAG: hypothetical protein GY860_25480 [Desulfobacteraceae bacterium]|nr:hypothetical protein [Desulfobacteraceae bacterium]
MVFFLIVATVSAAAAVTNTNYTFSYYANGRICIDSLGELNGRDPVTVPHDKGQEDFKPSWSKTNDMLVFFRRVKNDPVVSNWRTILCVINADGTGFQMLTDDKHTNFNPTWTRDVNNFPIWNRKHPQKSHYYVMQSKVENKPGQEVAISDKRFHTWAHSCLRDGRILVECAHPEQGFGYYLMTPRVGSDSTYKRIDVGDLLKKGLMCRISISPDENKICFGHIKGHKFKETGHAMVIADFDVEKRQVTNAKIIANRDYQPAWFAYPRWTKDGQSVIYHANTTGKGRLFLYTLKDGLTRKISTNDEIDYRYPHGEGAPK